MRLSVALVLYALSVVGCSKSGSVVFVSVTAAPALSSLARLHVTASAAGQTKQFDLPLTRATLPPAISFAIDVPPAIQGMLTLTVDAYGSGPARLATVAGSTSLAGGHREDLSLTLSTAMNDLGLEGSDGAVDMLATDLQPAADMTAVITAPRLLSPLSTSYVTATKPLLKWELHGGSPVVKICKDRFCVTTLATATVQPDLASAVPDIDLPAGVAFWRVQIQNGASTLTSPTWEFTVPHRTASNNGSYGTFLDVNGDGYADVLIGNSGNMPNPAGEAILYYGSSTGLQPTTAGKFVIIDGAAPNLLGSSAGSAGDVNGDGYGDLLVGGSYSVGGANVGGVWVYYGGPNGIQPGIGGAGIVIPGPDGANSLFGQQVIGAGDINGDGYGDIIVTVPSVSVGGNQPGRVHVYFGSAKGLQPDVATAQQSFDGQDGSALWADSVAAPGDLNGDGYADVVVGDGFYSSATLTHLGRVYVYFGSAVGFQPTTDGHFNHQDSPTGTANQRFGFSVGAVGDVDGDGIPDVAVNDGTDAKIYTTVPVIGAWPVPHTIANPDGAGSAFAIVPRTMSGTDSNGDGYSDVIIGNQNYNGNAGRAHVFFGGAAATIFSQSVIIEAPAGDQSQFGELVAGLGDVDGDGYAEIAISGPDVVDSRAYIFLGSSAGPQPTMSTRVIPFIGPSGAVEGSGIAALFAPTRLDMVPRASWTLNLGKPTSIRAAPRLRFTRTRS